jgi:hypothetical protein
LFPLPLYRVKDDVLKSLQEHPLRPSAKGTSLANSAEWLTFNDLEQTAIKLNADRKLGTIQGGLEWHPDLAHYNNRRR